MTMKKMISLALSVMLVFGLSVSASAQATAPSIDESILLEAAEPVIDAYKAHYVVEDVHATGITEVPKEDGGYYVEYILNFDATLKYDSALEIPKIKGIAKALNIDPNQSVDAFLADMRSASTVKSVDAEAKNDMQKMNLTATLNAANATDTLPVGAVSTLVANSVINNLANFVKEIEDEYIGESYEHNIGLRASIDVQGNMTELEYGVVDGYSKDISVILPESEKEMIQSGVAQVDEMVNVALYDLQNKQLLSNQADIDVNSNPNFKYYRVNARDYANRYTTNAASVTCTNKNCNNYNSTRRKAVGFWNNTTYANYCCFDCANYVSQAMKAGGVPTDSTWTPDSRSWRKCEYLRSYFYQNKKYWNLTTYSNCNAGGIILLHRKSGPSHAMMNVLNDGATIQYSAHTNDRNKFDYTLKSLSYSGITKIEFFIFDNVYPAH